MADPPTERIQALAEQVETLREENRQLRERVAELERDNERLRDELDQARREAARQAAPFRRREGTKVPPGQRKRPGRKPGHKASWRRPPPEVDETLEVPLPCCPVCGEALRRRRRIEQIIEEIPPMRPGGSGPSPTAERALRPAVIARKVSCGNRTDRGRRTWQTLASLGATCAQRGLDFADLLASHIRLAPSTR